MTTTYDIGDRKRLSMTFKNFADAPADPDAVTVTVTLPDGTADSFAYGTHAELINDDVGSYYIEYLFTQSGRHRVRFAGEGTIDSAESTDVYIRA